MPGAARAIVGGRRRTGGTSGAAVEAARGKREAALGASGFVVVAAVIGSGQDILGTDVFELRLRVERIVAIPPVFAKTLRRS